MRRGLARAASALAVLGATAWAFAHYGSGDAQAVLTALMGLCAPAR